MSQRNRKYLAVQNQCKSSPWKKMNRERKGERSVVLVLPYVEYCHYHRHSYSIGFILMVWYCCCSWRNFRGSMAHRLGLWRESSGRLYFLLAHIHIILWCSFLRCVVIPSCVVMQRTSSTSPIVVLLHGGRASWEVRCRLSFCSFAFLARKMGNGRLGFGWWKKISCFFFACGYY